MSTNARIGWNTLLKIGDGGDPESFTTISEVTDLSAPSGDLPFEEVTHMESPSGFREYIAAPRDPGNCTFVLNYNAAHATHQQLLTDYTNGTLRNFKITYPEGTVSDETFSAYVATFERPMNATTARKMNVTLRVSGSVTYPA